MTADATTKRWLRNTADRKAAAAGYTMNELQGMYFVWWIENYCVLWEGHDERFRLVSYYPDEPDWWLPEHNPPHRTITNEYGYVERYPWFQLHKPDRKSYSDAAQFKRDTQTHAASIAWTKQRVNWHLSRRRKKQHVDWQFECMMRCYGWVQSQPDDFAGYPLRRFQRADFWVAKKNKKSPTQAVTCIYQAAGDGEPGNHVYPAAADGGQSKRIIGTHVHKTVLRSPLLRHSFSLDTQSMKVEFLPTDSTIEPLSSNNVSTQKSKEGVNGDISIDEAHVVDRKFVGRVDRAGISRPEPFFMSFSTAGDEPDSWGRDWWESGVKNNGNGEDLNRLTCSYGVPERLEIKDLLADFERYARMANPAMDHTVKLKEIKADAITNKRSKSKAASLMRYRFNQWQYGSVEFIVISDWNKCKRSYRLEILAGAGGGLGLDLSITDDLTSAVFSVHPSDQLIEQLKIKLPRRPRTSGFPSGQGEYEFEDTIKLRAAVQWPVTWITEQKLERLKEEKPELADWAAAGELRVIDGRVVDRDRLLTELLELIRLIKTEAMSLDTRHAFELRASLEKATGLEIHEFPQTYDHYSLPTEHFERLVLQRTLIHPGNPMQEWQLANTKIKEIAGKRKPIKPTRHSNLKIDCTQAAIMSLDALSRVQPKQDTKFYGVSGA